MPADDGDMVWVKTLKGEALVTKRSLRREEHERNCPAKSKTFNAASISIPGRKYHLNENYTARQIALNHPDAPHTDKMGRCVFTSNSEEREFMAKTGANNSGATIEEGSTKDAGGAAPLPYEKGWEIVKNQARNDGHLPLKGETRRDMERRQDAKLRGMDRNTRERKIQGRKESKSRRKNSL